MGHCLHLCAPARAMWFRYNATQLKYTISEGLETVSNVLLCYLLVCYYHWQVLYNNLANETNMYV